MQEEDNENILAGQIEDGISQKNKNNCKAIHRQENGYNDMWYM